SSQAQTSPKPTIILVHGAFAESASWEGVIRLLLADGYPVIAAANPLRGVLVHPRHWAQEPSGGYECTHGKARRLKEGRGDHGSISPPQCPPSERNSKAHCRSSSANLFRDRRQRFGRERPRPVSKPNMRAVPPRTVTTMATIKKSRV